MYNYILYNVSDEVQGRQNEHTTPTIHTCVYMCMYVYVHVYTHIIQVHVHCISCAYTIREVWNVIDGCMYIYNIHIIQLQVQYMYTVYHTTRKMWNVIDRCMPIVAQWQSSVDSSQLSWV